VYNTGRHGTSKHGSQICAVHDDSSPYGTASTVISEQL
jgi:hypothetical protein